MQWGSFIWRRQYPGWYCKFESFHFQVVDKASQKAPLWKILINQAWQKFIKVDKSWRFRIILQNKPHMTQRKRRWLKSRDMERWQIVPWSHLYQTYEFITNYSTYLLTYSLNFETRRRFCLQSNKFIWYFICFYVTIFMMPIARKSPTFMITFSCNRPGSITNQ